MDYLLKFIETYPYTVLLLGSIIDQSGLPFFTILAGILYANGDISFIPAFLVIIFSYFITDILLVILGKYLYKKRFMQSKVGRIKTIDFEILNKGLNIYSKSKGSFYYFSKILPTFGKYAPIFSGLLNERYKECLFKYLLGDILYFLLFFIPSIFIGERLQQDSKIVGICLVAFFIVVYKLYEIKMKKNMKKNI